MQILTIKCYCTPNTHYHLTHNIRLTLIIGLIYNLVLHFQGNLVVLGTRDGDVQVYDIAANKQVNEMQSHSSRVGALACNGDIVSSGSLGRFILLCDLGTTNHGTEKTNRPLAGG
jgi:WD40 repeat protein